jgi:WD40 repeat protein
VTARRTLLAAALLLAACGTVLWLWTWRPAPAPIANSPVSLVVEKRLQLGTVPARELAFSRDGLLAMSSADGRLLVVAPNPDVRRRGGEARHPGGAAAIAFSSDGRVLATGGYDGAIRLWAVDGMRLLRRIPIGHGTIWSLDFSPDGARLASGGEDRLVRIWNVADGKPLAALAGHRLNIWKVRFSPDGKWLASSSFDHDIRLWDAATGRLVRTLQGHSQAVVGLAFSPDGRLLASGSDDSTVRIWRVSDGAPLRTLEAGNHAYDVAFSQDGTRLATSGRARGAIGTFVYGAIGGISPGDVVHLWRVSDGALLAAGKQPDDALYVAYAPTGDYLATAGEDGSVTFWSIEKR